VLHLGERPPVPRVAHEQVEEPGAGDLDAIDVAAERLLDRGAKPLGDDARLLAHRRRQQHRRVRRVVAEIRPGRALELGRRHAPAVAERGGGVGDGAAQGADRVCLGVRHQ
jgi:hypothetical protein